MKTYLVFSIILITLCGLTKAEEVCQFGNPEKALNGLLSGRKCGCNTCGNKAHIIEGFPDSSFVDLAHRLQQEESNNKLPVYAKIIALKLQSNASDLDKKISDKLISVLAKKILLMKDNPPESYLIQSCLRNLKGVNHEGVRLLIKEYKNSSEEWTRGAAIKLEQSINDRNPNERKIRNNITRGVEKARSTRITPSLKKTKIIQEEIVEEKKSNLPWIITGVLLLGILALLFKSFKRKSSS